MEDNQPLQRPSLPEQTNVTNNVKHKISRRVYIIIGIFSLIFIFCVMFFLKRNNLPISSTQPSLYTQSSQTNCKKAYGPLTQKGKIILQSNGTAYIPYGITTSGLSNANYQDRVTNDYAQIKAAATIWCANTVRLQVGQDNLVGVNGDTFSQNFMTAIENEVTYAKSLGLLVVINDQTESVGYEKGPTKATSAFWKEIANIYKNDPQVIFDLFNEPRVSKKNINATWQLWQNGGTNHGITYLGMQDIVNEVRSNGAKNLLWIEGPYTSSTLSEVLTYPITGEPLMYAIHHPIGMHTPQTWETDFGYLITQNIAPVVVGEWSNYASNKSECWSDAPTSVPQFLSYLQSKHIGMTVWTLKKGVLLESNNFSDPSQFKTNWSCIDGLNEGAGQLVINWFKSQN